MAQQTASQQHPRNASGPEGRFVTRGDRRYYQIAGVDRMPPFLMTVTSDSDLWMYLSSAGGLTAGRVEPDRAFFPYETDDRLHAASGISGPVTVIRLPGGVVWRPFDHRPMGEARERSLLRTIVGDAVVFEEHDGATGLTFRASWGLSDRHGMVRRCELSLDEGASPIDIELLDGLLNIMPAGVPLASQQASSTLVDAYKRAELDRSGLAIYALEAAIWDRPEARESLRANVCWRDGLPDASVSLDPDSVGAFARGEPVEPRDVVTGKRGAYICSTKLSLRPGASEQWAVVGDAYLDHADVAARARWLVDTESPLAEVEADLDAGSASLGALLDRADGAQLSADESTAAAHRSNVMFNAMRGGVPADEYAVDTADFRRFMHTRHRDIAGRHDGFVADLGERTTLDALRLAAETRGDPQLVRLAMEYLPLTFGRRHGDPSRPWNRFRIRMRDAAGHRALGYEGNWRDVFQNWEAVCASYPAMLPSVIAKFVNASTPDGHNPYRISEAGIDWEVPEPENPWAGIGYWGDHQVVYLLRLLEQLHDTDPSVLSKMLGSRVFSYADVPYIIKPFEDLVRDPKNSISFDVPRNERIEHREAEIGSDARLVNGPDGEPLQVSMLEKLLVLVLAKVANFVPDGGIWMNTQRPEWNDANNALTGYGLSMVTLYQLRRFVDFGIRMLEQLERDEIQISSVIAEWSERSLASLVTNLQSFESDEPIDDATRWRVLEALSRAGCEARQRMLDEGPGEPETYPIRAVTDLFRLTKFACDHAIRHGKRDDGLYESYNVLHIDRENELARVERLHVMLEGQVAALATGLLSASETADLIDALFDSPLYRADQDSFILYPHITRPRYLERNAVPDPAFRASPLLTKAVQDGQARLARRGVDGRVRFAPDLVGEAELDTLIGQLAADPIWEDVVRQDAGAVRAAYEATFQHARFTGRSGTMHKYEGIGSVYWHMVSKLILAVLECTFEARERGESDADCARLADSYRRVRSGLGVHKTPAVFGAVPHEPYSHTPAHLGAQQPGMTGQVKEGVLARFAELGVRLRGGEIRFEPGIIDDRELLTEATTWRGDTLNAWSVDVPAGAVAFTLCGVPVVRVGASSPTIRVAMRDGSVREIDGPGLGRELTSEILGRTTKISAVTVSGPMNA